MTIGPTFLGKTELPWAEGTHAAPEVRVHDIAPVGRKGKYTLTDLAADHVFFSAALLAATGLAVAPVAVYWAESGLPEAEAPVMVESPQVVLKGLQPPFDRTIYACLNEHAEGLLRFLNRFAVRRPDGLWESLHQVLPVADWAAVGRTSVAPRALPTKRVHLYGVQSAHGVFHWVPPRNPWKEPVCLKFQKRQETKTPSRRPFT